MPKLTETIKPQLFEKTDHSGWSSYLDTHGYVVIKDILTQTSKDVAYSLFKKDWKTVSPYFDFDDPESWSINNTPIMWGKGMAIFNGFGQSDFMWYLRTHPEIKNIFKMVYNSNQLVTSMDGFSVFLSKTQTSKSWLHIDQNPVNKIYSIQGSYNFMPVKTKEDAGFVVVPGSHKTFTPEVKHKNDWIVCEDQDKYIQQCRKLAIPENCLTLWNSKLIHANEGMSHSHTHLNRLTAYITYQPLSIRPPNILGKRIAAYKEGSTTSHWANRCELKRYPYGFKTRYESRGYHTITPTLDAGNIPTKRSELL